MRAAKNYDGLKVLDFSRVYAGPYLTMMLCDLGAEVIKIERPLVGADERGLGPFVEVDGRIQSGYFMSLNRGKKSVVLDLAAPESREAIHRLAAWADVVVENFKPGVMQKLGFAYDDLRQVNPRLVYCSISTFGQSGPLSRRPGYDIIAQATSGLMWSTGYPDRAPQPSGTVIGDANAATHALGAIGAALYYREKTGQGQRIDIAMRDCLAAVLETQLPRYFLSRGADIPARSGSHHPLHAPYGVYDAGHGRYLVLAVITDGQWAALCELMGKAAWGAQAKFKGAVGRGRNLAEVVAAIESWLQSFADLQDAVALLEAKNIPNTPIYSLAEVVNDPQYLARHNLVEVADPVAGPFTSTTTPMLFSATSAVNPAPAPLLGADTVTVLRDVARLPEERIRTLAARSGIEYK